MKISEYIEKLEQILHECGDLEIVESYIVSSSAIDGPPEKEHDTNPIPCVVDQGDLPEDLREKDLPSIYAEVTGGKRTF
jgi:hypothetical protein